MAKKGAKRIKGGNTIVNEKKKELQKFWDLVSSQFEEVETRMEMECNEACSKIQKMYDDKLKMLPENIRNMTLLEYMEMQKKAESPHPIPSISHLQLGQEYERSKMLSEKKRTQKTNRRERKRSLSVSHCSGFKLPQNLLQRSSRVMSESCLNTPLSKRSVVSINVVTPKFNPKVPIKKEYMRKPRAGEVLMSVSGSPLQNLADDIPDKPGLAVSLGGGKIIQITDDTDIAKLENEFVKKLDEDTKQTLANVKNKLDKILQS